MYVETIITAKARALALAKQGMLFQRNMAGEVRHADVAAVKATWGVYEFFACSHVNPRGLISR